MIENWFQCLVVVELTDWNCLLGSDILCPDWEHGFCCWSQCCRVSEQMSPWGLSSIGLNRNHDSLLSSFCMSSPTDLNSDFDWSSQYFLSALWKLHHPNQRSLVIVPSLCSDQPNHLHSPATPAWIHSDIEIAPVVNFLEFVWFHCSSWRPPYPFVGVLSFNWCWNSGLFGGLGWCWLGSLSIGGLILALLFGFGVAVFEVAVGFAKVGAAFVGCGSFDPCLKSSY